MIRQDYILRLIEELGQVWALVIARARAGRYDEALESLDDAAQRLLGLNRSLLDRLPSVELLRMLRIGDTLDLGKCVSLVELLGQEGEILELQGKLGAAAGARLKGLDVFLAVRGEYDAPELAERLASVERLIAKLEGYRLPAPTRLGLLRWYEERGRYADAEDALYDLLQEGHARSDAPDAALAEGVALYGRLLARGDDALLAGGLPRAEVEEGLAELRTLLARRGGPDDPTAPPSPPP